VLICDGVQAGDQTPAGEGDDGTGAGAAAAVQTREHSMSVSMGIGSDIVEDHHEAIAGRCMFEVYMCVRAGVRVCVFVQVSCVSVWERVYVHKRVCLRVCCVCACIQQRSLSSLLPRLCMHACVTGGIRASMPVWSQLRGGHSRRSTSGSSGGSGSGGAHGRDQSEFFLVVFGTAANSISNACC